MTAPVIKKTAPQGSAVAAWLYSPRVLSVVIWLLLWQLVVTILQPELLPAPTAVFESLWQHAVRGDLVSQLAVTLRRLVIAFSLALLLGMVLGLAMGHFKRLNDWLDSILTLMLNIPALVTIILCLMWLGLNEVAAVTAVVMNKLPNMAAIFREGAKAVNRELLEVAKVYRLPASKALFKVYLPQLAPYFLAAARTGQALVWKIVLVVELLGCSSGVGFKLSVFFQMFDITSILAYTLAFVAIIYSFESFILRPWERRINRWQQC
ncbi:ABC transporter permease [Halioxenophilus aromaticivorans]|uniref:ABC transporter permease n=2 Tax=Halioxenophilus aromaticivorans TaxID=1306992 RepID=A0AAV3U7H8_9ALTE